MADETVLSQTGQPPLSYTPDQGLRASERFAAAFPVGRTPDGRVDRSLAAANQHKLVEMLREIVAEDAAKKKVKKP